MRFLNFKSTRFMLVLAAIAVGACGKSPDEVGTKVQQAMQHKFDTDKHFEAFDLTVKKVRLVKQEGNHYQGVARVMYKGEGHDVLLDVTADDEMVIWKAEPTTLLFLASPASKAD